MILTTEKEPFSLPSQEYHVKMTFRKYKFTSFSQKVACLFNPLTLFVHSDALGL